MLLPHRVGLDRTGDITMKIDRGALSWLLRHLIATKLMDWGLKDMP